MIAQLAERRNKTALAEPSKKPGLPLPPDAECLLAPIYHFQAPHRLTHAVSEDQSGVLRLENGDSRRKKEQGSSIQINVHQTEDDMGLDL